MRGLVCFLALPCALSLAAPAAAQMATAAQPVAAAGGQSSTLNFVRSAWTPIASYGPFAVIEKRTAALLGSTDARSPAAFRAMLRDYPAIDTIVFIECPGTYDDRANLALGRLIRLAGLAVYVPPGGSVRSGAIDLMLAGTNLVIDDSAVFAVHAWRERGGREAGQVPADSWEHTKYLAYYREMGMTLPQAKAFYAMTNSAPHESPRWMSGSAMRAWVQGDPALIRSPQQLGRLDLGAPLH
ncbi:alpha/beta hydrolase [Croceibacterium sp. LX-88]|uniref:Alpha/beta hydrolase n=1 Tax=Croceibacterium selenioxidans TaxID=2838833 RepID=A0ABS5W7D0_9SPHN|nr:alpha/beta hydrolase [Croceibacterium selenioxidans]MBT2135668.1 alpha/beta hydrolase [Croceibacterium selenioxidans]